MPIRLGSHLAHQAHHKQSDDEVCMQRVLLILGILLLFTSSPSLAQQAGSLRFYGTGQNQVDRVKIPLTGSINVGGDFTIEFWIKALADENRSPNCQQGGDSWINGNIVIDRDVFGSGDLGDYGISVSGGKIAFGVAQGDEGNTICSNTSISDGAWHHIALTRDSNDGTLRIFIDGQLDQSGSGPQGDISYRIGRSSDYANDAFLVIGAEKHDYSRDEYPSFSGWLDELRISSSQRYSENFQPETKPFEIDDSTLALYHMDAIDGEILPDSAQQNNGTIYFGGDPAGPVFDADTPFSAQLETEPTATVEATEEPTALPTSEPTAEPSATVEVQQPTEQAADTPIPAPSFEPTLVSNPAPASPPVALDDEGLSWGWLLILFALLAMGIGGWLLGRASRQEE